MRRLLKALLVGLLLLVAVGIAWDVATYDRRAWASDFARLKRDMAQGYANLDWIASHRKLDLAALSRDTERRLDSAHSRVRAWFALRDFIERFDDPHFRAEDRDWGESGGFVSSIPPPPKRKRVGKDCAASDYSEGDHDFTFPWERIPGWRPLAQGNFPTGLAGSTGVIRIAQFSEHAYLSACTRAFRPGLWEYRLQLETRHLLQADLRHRIAQLKRLGASRIVVDLTGNGGGTEWVEQVAALFTARTLVRPPQRLIGPACDRSAVWDGKPPPCPVFKPAPAEPARLQGTGEWQGPLLVLVDRFSASASEDFVNWIKDGGVAPIVGERTMGAGCGFINGGTKTRLKVLPVDIRMPNCARFLKNGLNEVEGIPPDVPLPMEEPDEAADALARLLAR